VYDIINDNINVKILMWNIINNNNINVLLMCVCNIIIIIINVYYY